MRRDCQEQVLERVCLQHSRRFQINARLTWGILRRTWWFVVVALIVSSGSSVRAQEETEEIQDITGKYHFLSADDTLGILEEDGRLKGYIDIYQGEEESDVILSYNLVQGWRKKAHVEFRTNKIHRKYYRFSGKVERGTGHEEVDPDYLRLVGDIELVTIKGDSGEEAVQRTHVIFKSFGKSERGEE